MKQASLVRFTETPSDRTLGLFRVIGNRQGCFVIEPGSEDPHGARVPDGVYLARWIHSPTFGWTWTLVGHGVSAEPGEGEPRSQIRIHAGNDDEESRGCLLPGLSIVWDPRDEEPAVADSRKALNWMLGALGPADFLLTIVSAPIPAG